MENITYEEATKELNQIIAELEQGNIPMNKAIELFTRGQQLIKICYNYLDKAKGTLSEIKVNLDNIEEE